MMCIMRRSGKMWDSDSAVQRSSSCNLSFAEWGFYVTHLPLPLQQLVIIMIIIIMFVIATKRVNKIY